MKAACRTKQQFAVCYLTAALIWVLYCLLGSATMLYHKSNGTMPQQVLMASDLTFSSFVNYADREWDTAPDSSPDWYLSTDDDPQITWYGTGYLENVTLHALHLRPAGSVALYYLKPGQTDFSEQQKIYAAANGNGEYTFDLGGRVVSGLRIDPDSVGGVPTKFSGITLNPVRAWYLRFVPNGAQWILLLGLPALAAALWELGAQTLKKQSR
jgi:hypothetical protein